MFFTFDNNSTFMMPVCFHPTTTMLVDDDADFLKSLSLHLKKQVPVVSFTDPDKAISFLEKDQEHFNFKNRCLYKSGEKIIFKLASLRNEIYNENRFKEIITTVLDYDMPNKTGFDVMKTMQFPLETPLYSYILLTGAPVSEFDEELLNLNEAKSLISKSDPDYLAKLIQRINDKSATIFQWLSYEVARTLSLDATERASFLLDGNFLPLFNEHIQNKNICELYLFDKQGSYLFLDADANLSWLFMRNEIGMKNTIQFAEQYHAPQSVINALKKKEVVLSLYEKEDFELRNVIDWDNYLLPAAVFKGDDTYLKRFNLSPGSNYYYAFTDHLPNHGIDQEKILSYRTFLKEASKNNQ